MTMCSQSPVTAKPGQLDYLPIENLSWPKQLSFRRVWRKPPSPYIVSIYYECKPDIEIRFIGLDKRNLFILRLFNLVRSFASYCVVKLYSFGERNDPSP